MITLGAKIDIVKGDEITNATINIQGSNISGDLPLGNKKNTQNPLLLDVTKLGQSLTLEEKVDYFIGSQSSNENGQFNIPYTIQISAKSPLSYLTIAFDTQNKRHPHSIVLTYGSTTQTYYDDDSIFTITIPQNTATTYTIEISNWNTPNFPLVISGIYINISIDINKRNLISFNREIVDRADIKFPSYGIISNIGKIEFKDLDGEVRDYAEQMLLTSDLKVKINLNNTLTKKTEQVSEFITKEWDYDNDNKVVSVSLKDDLEEWQNTEQFSVNLTKNSTGLDLYQILKDKTPSKFEFEELDQNTTHFLENCSFKFLFLKQGNLWQQWTKLCVACALHIYKDKNGKVKVISALEGL